ncbi:S8 family serine peptidase [Kribbella sp. CA-293567]|uniref:S8 family serine peptidase n=1 Tax=Kribbella sp. CA-293567 TaxID=3002436 RepID=UPI0022DE47EC|nr:S8 family serine peptidase [Kribbella sp. CA-293567]WBQ05725.1 S8 family serine peptidase [Kribbella sp. CA-293567]
MSPRSRTRRLSAGLAVVALAFAGVGTAAAHAAPVSPFAQAAAEPGILMNYVVNTKPVPIHVDRTEQAIEAAGGTVVKSYGDLGVVIAQSTSPTFRADVRLGKNGNSVQSVGATRTAAVSEGPVGAAAKPAAAKGLKANESVPALDPREGEQWDMAQIKADKAHEQSDGSSRVLVGINDSGVDDTHPDLAPNFDAGNSVNCVDNGVADTTPGGWRPTTSDHGTHVAGTVASARNGVGIVGVAPGVRIASVKVVNDDGYIYPEYAICGFVWAAEHKMDVTNHSYFIDPWEFWCKDDADQGAVQEAVRRAVAFATSKGSLAVAAAGNSSYDLANKTTDSASPNDGTPATRPINNDCLDIPTELPGVVTVASTTRAGVRSNFSNYGLNKIDVAAPGSSILSTIPGGGYGLKSGTSMASPHVAGVAALIKSNRPWLKPAEIEKALRVDADDQACPAVVDARCTGTTANNSFFGEGLVDALDGVKRW